VNEAHRVLCAGEEWARTVRQWIMPWVLDGVDLGDDVLEVGPGPGATTDVLRERAERLTVVEADADAADALRARLPAAVEVVHGDATSTDFADRRFSAVACLTMLHHVPSVPLQDALLAEARRVLRDGGVLVGEDSLDGPEFRELHCGDVCVPVPPDSLGHRLRRAGFADVRVDVNEYAVRFVAR
jgi:SAM-dependent methyltransferase